MSGLTAEALRKLASLDLSQAQMAGVLDILADAYEAAERARANSRRRVAAYRDRLNLPAKEWARLRMAVINRDGPVCGYCERLAVPPYVDHVVPLSQGGTNDLSNLIVSCGPCNSAKAGRTVDEWEASR